MKNISIIGGGILGLTLAQYLSDKGYNVTVFEASSEVGGLANSWNIGNMTWDRFYHVILLSDLYTRQLLKTAEMEDKIKWKETKTGFYVNGKMYSMSNIIEFLKFPPIGFIDKIRLGITIFLASRIKNPEKLENITSASWLLKWSGRRNFKNIWQPLLKAKLGDYCNNVSAVFIWATIRRMYAARESGLKKEMFGYIQGGYSTILQAILKNLRTKKVTVYKDHRLSEMEISETKKLKFTNGSNFECDTVIFTIPSPSIISCWETMPEIEKKLHSSLTYMGICCTSVLLRKPLGSYYVTNITDDWVPFTGIIEMTALVDKEEFDGNTLVYLPKYASKSDKIFSTPDQEIHQEFKDALLKMYPFLKEDDIIEMKTAREQNVFSLITLNYNKQLPNIQSEIKGVYYANSALITSGTVNVNETIKTALEVSELFEDLNK